MEIEIILNKSDESGLYYVMYTTDFEPNSTTTYEYEQ
jgi:hypothetical protein